MNQVELAKLRREAETELKKCAGVAGVGYGYKERSGQLTPQLAFRVYVEEKKDAANLHSVDIVPSSFKGIPTDVLVRRKTVPLAGVCDDHETHSPLIGGIAITTFKTGATGKPSSGTLGFFAYINGRTGNNNVALISNHHVLAGFGEKRGDTVYQPAWKQIGGQWFTVEGASDSIADLLTFPDEDNYLFTYPGEPEGLYYIDCASAQLNICISPTCHTNCGVKFANSLRGFSLNGSDHITGVGRMADADVGHNDTVYKSGATTGITIGKVVDASALVSGFNVMEIQPTQANCHGNMLFSEHGDSGAAVINTQGQIVGILFGHDQVTGRTHACHIHPMMSALGITPITSENAPVSNPAYSQTAAASSADATASKAATLRNKMKETEVGRRMTELVEKHHLEVVHLVNHRRRALVAWHRGKGPLFLNEAAANINNPEHKIPRELEGISREALLQGMAQALIKEGSTKLRRDIELHLKDALAYATVADSVPEMIERFVAAETVTKAKIREESSGKWAT